MPPPEHQDPTLPPPIEAELRRAFSFSPSIPSQRDDAVLSLAKRHFLRPIITRIGLRRLVIPAAAIALVLIFVWYAIPLIGPARQGPPSIQGWPVPGLTGEVRVEGHIDILSALRLAKALQWGQSRPEWDVNGDGHVDYADVDALALRAVSLGDAP